MRRARYGVLALLIVGGTACGSNDASAPVASATEGTSTTTPSASSPSATPSAAVSTCTEAKAADLTADDPFTLVVRNFKFTPDCFIARLSASVVIENKEDVPHTFSIQDTLYAPLPPNKKYKHGPRAGLLDPGTYPFYCSIHPEMTGTMIVV